MDSSLTTIEVKERQKLIKIAWKPLKMTQEDLDQKDLIKSFYCLKSLKVK